MRRLTSLLIHAGSAAIVVAVIVATPAATHAQQQPAPPRNLVEPVFTTTPETPSPTPQAVAPVATPAPNQNAPRAETPRMPSLIGPTLSAQTNIRLELKITDNYGGTPVAKTVTLLLANGFNGMIRTNNRSDNVVNATLNVDAVAAAYPSGAISVRLTFEYTPAALKEGPGAGRTSPTLNESIVIVLQDGKPMMVSQSADPGTDRKVTAELTATILK